MRRKPYLIIFSVITAILMVDCTDNSGKKHAPQSSGSLYTEERAMAIYDTLPEWALQILDSAEAVGNLPDYRAALFRAKVLSSSTTMQQNDSAIIICEALLRHDEAQHNVDFRQDLYVLLLNAAQQRYDYEDMVHWGTEQAYGYLSRYGAIESQLHDRLQRSKAHLYAVRYHTLELETALNRARVTDFRSLFFNVVIGMILFIVAMAAYYFYRQRRILNEKNHVLVQKVLDSQEYKRLYRQMKSQKKDYAHSDAENKSVDSTLETMTDDNRPVVRSRTGRYIY